MSHVASVFSAVAIVLAVVMYMMYSHSDAPKLPELDYDKWWGVGEGPETNLDNTIRPYIIQHNESIIRDLTDRIINRRPITTTLDGAYSTYGTNSRFLERTLSYWVSEYDFKDRIDKMNSLPHYITNIQGLDIHFIRVKPTVSRDGVAVLPLLLLHGWPSSSREFLKVIPMLAAQSERYSFVFEVIAPDLPGFGFSQGTTKKGLNPAQMGIIMRNLMMRLGYTQFYVQGGDWGSQCAAHMSTLFPDEILGYHTTMPLSSKKSSMIKFFLWYMFPYIFGEQEHINRVYPLSNYASYIVREFGYFHIQATKPDSIGVALTDSPSGLAAYIMDKMAMCTNRDQLDTEHGGLHDLDVHDVLDTVTVAWLAATATTSMRIYAEGMVRGGEISVLHEIPTPVPTAVLNFKYEVLYQPNFALRDKFPNIVHTTTVDFGGHFAAMQTPKEYTEDVFQATIEFLNFHEKKKTDQRN